MVKIKILVTLTQITFWPRILNYSINLADRFTNVARYAFISRIPWRYARWMWFAVRTLLWTFDAEVSDCCRYLLLPSNPTKKSSHLASLFRSFRSCRRNGIAVICISTPPHGRISTISYDRFSSLNKSISSINTLRPSSEKNHRKVKSLKIWNCCCVSHIHVNVHDSHLFYHDLNSTMICSYFFKVVEIVESK